MDAPINNAKLISVGLYFDLVPAFERLLALGNGSLGEFYASCQELAELDNEARRAQLAEFIN